MRGGPLRRQGRALRRESALYQGVNMDIGVPREHLQEYRVGLSPDGVAMLVADGHHVYVQSKAGVTSGFSDEDYRHVGGQVVYSDEEVYGRADLIAKLGAPSLAECDLLRHGQIVCGFLHMAVAPKNLIQKLLDKEITAIAYETIQTEDGRLPVVTPMSEIAGRMIPLIAGQLLMNTHGGKGILLGGVPGIPAADVAIVGGGVVGSNAAKAFLGLGAQVTVLDLDPARLRDLDERLGGRANLMLATAHNLKKVCSFADVLVGAILIPGERAPRLITRQMVRSMKSRSVIMDISIDQGGCVETSRPTTIDNPTYVAEDVIHYCVPNMSSVIARTASQALTYAALPFIKLVAKDGLHSALRSCPALAKGVMLTAGRAVGPSVAIAVGQESMPLASVLKVIE
jgi:alanine dehydrogenase